MHKQIISVKYQWSLGNEQDRGGYRSSQGSGDSSIGQNSRRSFLLSVLVGGTGLVRGLETTINKAQLYLRTCSTLPGDEGPLGRVPTALSTPYSQHLAHCNFMISLFNPFSPTGPWAPHRMLVTSVSPELGRVPITQPVINRCFWNK